MIHCRGTAIWDSVLTFVLVGQVTTAIQKGVGGVVFTLLDQLAMWLRVLKDGCVLPSHPHSLIFSEIISTHSLYVPYEGSQHKKTASLVMVSSP